MIRLTPRLLKAARALVGWQQDHLAEASGVSKSTIGAFEAKDETAKLATMNNKALAETLTTAGVQFIPENGGGAGVRLAKLGRGYSVSNEDAVSIEQQKANADDVRSEAAEAVDRVLEKAERREALTEEPAVIAAARGKGRGRKR
jgi:DNA-binding XRE family transcriptional regulator